MPAEPPPSPSPWAMPDPLDADEHGLVGVGADLQPGTVLAAYRSGLFPMPMRASAPIGWWSPDPRGILPLDGLRVSRSLQRSRQRFEIRIDTAFDEVVTACADVRRPHGWISADIQAAYRVLHDLGWAHCVEAWTVDDDPVLAGGLYGVAIGGLFAGESMFHHRTDASKVALVALVELLLADGHADRLLDIQWVTPHLASLGAIEISAAAYQQRLRKALPLALPAPFM